ncbi:MAG: penicillin acylase family protein [Gammaproteobacteria bacterium]|nr:penicillin acylase family protein [Gammaproteobacteria bacterium]
MKWTLLFLFFLSLIAFFILRASLPDLSGTENITLLNQSVTIDRDVQGIPTIHAKHRQDTAFALGYLHAQERYFQMDLMRRSAVGEMAALFGNGALESDKKVKLHRFKTRARETLRRLPKAHYAVLMSYVNGVNTGIESLTNDPYQYLLLGQLPEPWELEDSLLCVYAMYFDLNDELGERETSLSILKDELPQQWFDFLTPKGGIWDAAMDGGELEDTQLSIPNEKLPDSFIQKSLKKKSQVHEQTAYHRQSNSNFLPGSNSWAIDSSLTSSSAAMLANDMHLTLRMPNIWYRASWYLDDGRRITGITLPGVPAMVAGSNEKVAWGFTNSYGDWGDVIALKTNETNTQYQTSKGWKDFELYDHLIASSNGPSQEHISIETELGPVIGKNHKGELLVHQWLAYAPQAVNLNVLELEKSESVSEAMVIAPTMGIPPQSIVIADSEGHIGWTIAGLIPKRAVNTESGEDEKQWQGYLDADDYPSVVDPEKHRIWSANNRLVTGEKLSKIGFEGGDLGARSQQVRNELLKKEQFKEADLLAIQLDARSVFLQRWQKLLLNSIESADAKMVDSPKSATQLLMIDALKNEPDLSADSDSVAYGLVRAFRKHIVNQTIGWIFDTIENNNPKLFKRSSIDKMIEYPVWELMSKKPEHLIPQGYNSWDDFILAASEKAYNEVTQSGQMNLAQQSWGKLHKVEIQHPLSVAIPGLGLFLDMPESPLSGDDNMPKVLGSDFGASMRMVISPGKEADGILHMPGGQSSHPLSSYYSSGHQDWVEGKPSAFLPGETEWTLTLKSLQ